MHYRNPFRDPDEAGYIRRAKEAGQSVYAVYYKEYYEEKEGNTYFRFTCEVQADAQKINEDTCYPERKIPLGTVGMTKHLRMAGSAPLPLPRMRIPSPLPEKSVSRMPQAERITAISI